jgi:hypothetical protein
MDQRQKRKIEECLRQQYWRAAGGIKEREGKVVIRAGHETE